MDEKIMAYTGKSLGCDYGRIPGQLRVDHQQTALIAEDRGESGRTMHRFRGIYTPYASEVILASFEKKEKMFLCTVKLPHFYSAKNDAGFKDG